MFWLRNSTDIDSEIVFLIQTHKLAWELVELRRGRTMILADDIESDLIEMLLIEIVLY